MAHQIWVKSKTCVSKTFDLLRLWKPDYHGISILVVPQFFVYILKVFHRRINGEVDFYLDWDSYVKGFGNKNGEFWIGVFFLV